MATCDNSNREFVFVASGTTVGGVDVWVLDTGVTQHMTVCATLLNNVTMEAPVKLVMFGNHATLDVTGQGDLRLMVDHNPLTIKNVLVVPGLGANLLSVSQFTRKGMRVKIEGTTKALSKTDGLHIGMTRQAGGFFILDASPFARYSSPATAALSRLMLPYHFPDLAAFATVTDLVAHLRTSDARYRAALPTEDHFLSLCPTELTVDLLEEGVPLSPFSPLLLLLLLSTSLALRRSELRLPLVGDAATPRARGARVVEGVAGEAVEEVEEAEGVAVEVGVVPGMVASVEAAAGVVEAAAAVVEVAAAMVPYGECFDDPAVRCADVELTVVAAAVEVVTTATEVVGATTEVTSVVRAMYAAHQINLQPRLSLPETTPTLRWTGKVGDASAFRVWGSRAFVRDTSADKLSSRA
ncbi:unnamed protein product, partial [Closterium sp. NIES-53]